MNILFNAMFVIVPIFIFIVFIFTIAMIISPKIRGKMMSRQIKAAKYMLEEAQDDLSEMGTTMGKLTATTENKILTENEELSKDSSRKKGNIAKEEIEIKTRAIKEGLSGKKVYCKHCGSLIDEDSKFCKSCGKEI